MANVRGSNYKAVCDTVVDPSDDVCYALVRTDVGGAPDAVRADVNSANVPRGYGPADLQAAYRLPSSSGGSGQVVALVESGDYPTAAADLAIYRKYYGLPPAPLPTGASAKSVRPGRRRCRN